jgi:hypothetical protein
MKRQIFLILIIGILTGISRSAWSQDWVAYYAVWSGSSQGNNASATATFDLNVSAVTTALSTDSQLYGSLDGYITNLTMTVTDANKGNGTFTASDFRGFLISFFGPMDFNSELVSQPNFWEFGLDSSNGAPDGEYSPVNTLVTYDGITGNRLQLISITPVPEPSSFMLAVSGGLSGFHFLRRRK